MRKGALWIALALLMGILLLGCGGSKSTATPEAQTGSEDFPVKDPAKPFALNEKGTVSLANDQEYEVVVQRDSGSPLFTLSIKKTTIIESKVDFTIQTIQPQMPEDLAARYVPLAPYALEMHVVGDSGYGFSLRPKLQLFFSDADIEAAKTAGASLDTLKGNILILYKEQRAPQWTPQTSASIDETTKSVSLSNVAGSGAWWLVAKKSQ